MLFWWGWHVAEAKRRATQPGLGLGFCMRWWVMREIGVEVRKAFRKEQCLGRF